MFSANRWELADELKAKLNTGTPIVLDRYVISGCAYTMAKGYDREWCISCDRGLPKPDLTIFLKLSPQNAAARGQFGDEIYETTDFQVRVEESYNQLLVNDQSVLEIDAT
jgi:dTMP kinase